MGSIIPPEYLPTEYLFSVEMVFDQFSGKFGSHQSCELATTAAQAIEQALGDRKPDEITMVRCRVIAPGSYNLKGNDDGDDTTQRTRYSWADYSDVEGGKVIPGY